MARSDWRRPSFEPPKDNKRRIKLVISYDGSSFSGWQKQNGAISVQEEIERALESCLGEKIEVFGSGRTDSGVHALAQVAHFDTDKEYQAEKFAFMLNSNLSKSIRIVSSEEGGANFHARFTTMAREYTYLLKEYKDMLPFDYKRITPIKEFPSLTLLNEYASVIKGTHDFTTFASSKDLSESKMRDIYESQWNIRSDTYNKNVLEYKVVGNAFLYHQVRSMVGTMLEAAKRGETKTKFEERLNSKDRKMAFTTAKSDGLYLSRISYDESEYQWFEEIEYGKDV